jgi:hypothetical protein
MSRRGEGRRNFVVGRGRRRKVVVEDRIVGCLSLGAEAQESGPAVVGSPAVVDSPVENRNPGEGTGLCRNRMGRTFRFG